MPSTAARALLESADLRQLVARRWRVSLLLSAVLFVVYYGFILLVALGKPQLSQRIGATTTVGIVLGMAVIAMSWLLTAIYVVWANASYDPEVIRLRKRLPR